MFFIPALRLIFKTILADVVTESITTSKKALSSTEPSRKYRKNVSETTRAYKLAKDIDQNYQLE